MLSRANHQHSRHLEFIASFVSGDTSAFDWSSELGHGCPVRRLGTGKHPDRRPDLHGQRKRWDFARRRVQELRSGVGLRQCTRVSEQRLFRTPGKVGGTVSVNATLLTQADSDARAASAQAAALTATQSFATITRPTTITGNGGLNVIAGIKGNIDNALTLKGTASDVFVINVSGNAELFGKATLGLSGGVTPNHVLYNFTANKGLIDIESPAAVSGTLLALTRA